MKSNPELYVGRYLGNHARIGSFLIMTTDGVLKAAGFRRMNVENRWNVDAWGALRDLPWDVAERGANTAEAIQAPRPRIVYLSLAPRRRLCHEGQSTVQRVLTELFMGRQQHLTRVSVGHVNRTPTHTTCTDVSAHHTAPSDHFSSREHARLNVKDFCAKNSLSSTRHVSFLAAPDTDHQHKFSHSPLPHCSHPLLHTQACCLTIHVCT